MARVAFGTRVRRRQNRKWLGFGLLLATTALVMAPRVEAAGEILDLSRPDLGWIYYGIPAVSADGTIFVGNVDDVLNSLHSVYYEADGGVTSLGSFGGSYSEARGMSGDGRYIVGRSRLPSGHDRAFRWDATMLTMQDLGLLYVGIPNAQMDAWDVSGDGKRVVGGYKRPGMTRAWAWIEGATTGEVGNEQMFRLNGLDDAGHWAAHAVSDDGNYAAGYSDGNATLSRAVRWDLRGLEAGGSNADIILDLGSLTGEMTGSSRALDISADGRVVVGQSNDDVGHPKAFRWVEGATTGVVGNVQMYNLGSLGSDPFNHSAANAVSRDGTIVVGWSDAGLPQRLAFRWVEETGMESVHDWLGRHGVSVEADQYLMDATAVSDDGTVVAGVMALPDGNERAYLARVSGQPGPGPGLMDVAEYNATLHGAAGIASAGEFLTWLPMNGAHHRPLMLTPNLSGDMCAWATGDFAHYGESGANLALAETGACVDLAGGSVRLGGSIGTTASWQALSLGGAANMVGQYVLGEVDWQPDGTPLLLSVTGMLGGWQAKVDRAYSNGAATAVSSGQTNAMGGVVRVRADWLEAAVLGNTSLNPWASVSFGALHVDGYSESGGPFPARFAAQNLGHTDIRVGVTATTEFSSQTKLSTTLEVAHRTGAAASAVGQVDGLFSFSLGGGTYGQTWGRLGLELDHKINDAVALSGSVHLATNGRDPTVAISAGIKGAF